MRNILLFIFGILLLTAAEIAKVYFIMPMPGSQEAETIDFAYWIHQNIWIIRVLGWLLIAYPVFKLLTEPKRVWRKASMLVLLAVYGTVFYLFNFKYLAEKMFYQPRNIVMLAVKNSKIPPNKLVLGLVVNGQARAYPIQFIGYHHQVRDTVGGEPVMITYCTVCRTGRVFRPLVGDKKEEFRLVGMDHFNAMFEDKTTGSWWRQVNGEAIAGPLKGQYLPAMQAEQMTLQAWSELHPETLVLQPDSTFKEQYASMEPYEKGKVKRKLTGRDSLAWKPKSWVVGVEQNKTARAYDWSQLLKQKVTNDSLAGTPLLLMVASDSATFHVWNRKVNGQTLHFSADSTDRLRDQETGSVWNRHGICTDGLLKGKKLARIPASQEYLHSWETFHPASSRYL
ncbi:DUF3179 domain-containing (seleno)protein [Larkinella rosea]|uniref:DUF3179 domain-containing protein n=1 Tax=Larkinella rosea TaxID=2025312 RepID=A0A3P1BIA7_9BACT|nr:DUF3179 domain-containing (seleno)protein [Larkinella rosea]RRB00830.1 DUF3179 domain-containing protein [Larkinella rosea]